MAKKKEVTGMVEALSEFKELKNIDKETMLNIFEDSLRSILAKIYGSDDNFSVIVNAENDDFEIWRTRMVVADGEVENEITQVAYSEAIKIDPNTAEGEELAYEVDHKSFSRRAILTLRQTLSAKILDIQKEHFYQSFANRVGEMIQAEVYQVWKRETLLIDEDGHELMMPKSEQIPGDFFKKGDIVRAVISRVDNQNNTPRVTLSRTDPNFLKRLFELNVPEIADGLITIKRVARIPGERAKVAVESYDDRVDPVGSCVGMNGSRIRGIVKELRGENIDVMPFTTNNQLLIQRALSPAKVTSIRLLIDEDIDEEGRVKPPKAEVFLNPNEVPLAIGKGASNIKLASSLTGFEIEVFKDVEAVGDDIYLSEFNDEIEDWIIKTLQDQGFNTARDILTTPRAELLQKTDLETITIDQILYILAQEFIDELDEMSIPDENRQVINALDTESSIVDSDSSEEESA